MNPLIDQFSLTKNHRNKQHNCQKSTGWEAPDTARDVHDSADEDTADGGRALIQQDVNAHDAAPQIVGNAVLERGVGLVQENHVAEADAHHDQHG